MLSCLAIEPVRGFNNDVNKISVKVTVICAITLFPFLNHGVKTKRIAPAKTGISAVNEGDSELKYPQSPMTIKTSEFKRFALYGFIFEKLNVT
jgi:hypothetical protein